MSLSLDVISVACFAFAGGMVFVLHFVEKPANDLFKSNPENLPETPETNFLLVSTKTMLGQFLAAGVVQIKAGLLAAGTAVSAILVYLSGDYVSLRALLVLCGIVFIPIMAGTTLPAAKKSNAVATTTSNKEMGAALRPLLNRNRIGSIATLLFFLFALLVSWHES